jgi:hypothetical protein
MQKRVLLTYILYTGTYKTVIVIMSSNVLFHTTNYYNYGTLHRYMYVVHEAPSQF